MTKKQKKMLIRIIIAFLLFAGLLICGHTGLLNGLSGTVYLFLIYLIPYLVIGYDIILKAARNIRHGQVFDENFLMMIATFGAFGVGEYSEGVAVMLFYQVGELFQGYAVGKSRQSISAMMDICPEYANIEIDGKLTQVDPDEVELGSVIVIKPGERIPLDGVVLEGESFIDTAALTGESVPRRAAAGDEVISGCVNGGGTLKVKTSKEFDDSTVVLYTDSYHLRCGLSGAASSYFRWELWGMDQACLYFSCDFLPLCIGDFRAPWLFRRDWRSFPDWCFSKGQ